MYIYLYSLYVSLCVYIYKDSRGTLFLAQLCKTKFVKKLQNPQKIYPPQEHLFERIPVLWYPKKHPAKPKVNLSQGILWVTPAPGQTQRKLEISTQFLGNTSPCVPFLLFFQRPLFCEGIFVSSSLAKGFVRLVRYWLRRFRVNLVHGKVISVRTDMPSLI